MLDCSVVMAWCVVDKSNDYADQVLAALESVEAVAPAIWPLAVGNVLAVAERRNRLTAADSVRFLSLIQELPIRVIQETPERMIGPILSLARANEFSFSRDIDERNFFR